MNSAQRWRLLLGKYSEKSLCECDGSSALNEAFDTIYGDKNSSGHSGDGYEGDTSKNHGRGPSKGVNYVEAYKYLDDVLSAKASELVLSHAIEHYDLHELIGTEEVVKTLPNDITTLTKLLTYKELAPNNQKQIKTKIKKIANQIKKELLKQVNFSPSGRVDRLKTSKFYRNNYLNFKTTLFNNLKNYNKDDKKLYIEDMYFHRTISEQQFKHIYLVIDQSGSMTYELAYCTIIASIFYNLKPIKVHIILFDTRIVDYTNIQTDPIEVLSSVTLGGGTDIPMAINYTIDKMIEPNKSFCLIVSDLYDMEGQMFTAFKKLSGLGVKIGIVPGISQSKEVDYNKGFAKKLKGLNIETEVCTPDGLAKYIKKILYK